MAQLVISKDHLGTELKRRAQFVPLLQPRYKIRLNAFERNELVRYLLAAGGRYAALGKEVAAGSQDSGKWFDMLVPVNAYDDMIHALESNHALDTNNGPRVEHIGPNG